MNSPTRRSVVRAAAWTVPAVSLVAAAPSYAGTGQSTLVFDPGSSYIMPVTAWAPEIYYDLVLVDASVSATGTAGPSTLTITVNIVPGADTAPGGIYYHGTPPSGWSGPGVYDPQTVLVLTAMTDISGGDTILIPNKPASDGGLFGTENDGQTGRFELYIEAPGFHPTLWLSPPFPPPA